MTEDTHTFRLPAAALQVMPDFHVEVRALSCRIADAMGETGLSYAQAASAAAHVLLAEAWCIAVTGRLAEGGTPDPELFYAAARHAVERVTFRDRLDFAADEVGQ